MLKRTVFSDQEIIDRVRQNDRTVLGEIFLKYEKVVCTYVKRHGGSADDAEDILQETIIVFWQKAVNPDFKLSAKLSTFLVAVAKNKWMAEMRKKSRQSDNIESQDLTDHEPTSLEIIMEDEKIDLIEQALSKLNKTCKDILMMYYFEERSMKNIAELLNFAGASVVKAKKYQCKKALEEILHQHALISKGE